MASGYTRYTILGDAKETAYGDGLNFGTGVFLSVESDFGLFPRAALTELERQIGVSEAPELIDSGYDVEGPIPIRLYPSTAFHALKWALNRSGTPEDVDSFVVVHYTGVEANKTRKNVGTKVSRVTFAAEKANPALVVTLECVAQSDSSINDIAAASLPSRPATESYEFIRGWFEPRDDKSQAGSSLVADVTGFSLQLDQSLQEQGRKPQISDDDADPQAWRSVRTGMQASIPKLTGNFTIRPTSLRFLEAVQKLKSGSLYAYFANRFSRKVTATSNIAAGDTSFGLAQGEVDQKETFTAAGTANLTSGSEHGLKEGDTIRVSNSGGALPAELSAGTTYYVLSSGLTATVFQIATTRGGSALTVNAGTGTHTWWHFSGTPFTFDSTADVDDVNETITEVAHGLMNGDVVFLEVVSGAVPTGLTALTVYYVVGAKADTFQLSATRGGAAISLTDAVGVTRVLKLAGPIVVNDVLLFYASGSPDQVECVKVTGVGTGGARTVTISGRGSNSGFRFAWTAASTKVYTLGAEIFAPGFRAETAPPQGRVTEIISQQVTIRADAVSGAAPLKVGIKDYYMA